MKYLNLDLEKMKVTIKELNILLADYHLYYQKLRNFHWNIVGRSFFELHVKFEEMYNDSLLKIDEIAERILTLRSQPISNYSDYLKIATIQESPSTLNATEMVETILKDHGILLQQLRAVGNAAADAEDEGTSDIVGGYIRDLEKTSWMLDAYITKDPKMQQDLPQKVKAKAKAKAVKNKKK